MRRVDALCKEGTPALAAIRRATIRARDAARAGRASPAKTFETFVTLLDRASGVTDRLGARLRSIEAPRGEQAFHDALIDSIEEASSNLRGQVSAAKAQDALELRELSVKGSLINAERKGLVAGHGGFRFCGQG